MFYINVHYKTLQLMRMLMPHSECQAQCTSPMWHAQKYEYDDELSAFFRSPHVHLQRYCVRTSRQTDLRKYTAGCVTCGEFWVQVKMKRKQSRKKHKDLSLCPVCCEKQKQQAKRPSSKRI